MIEYKGEKMMLDIPYWYGRKVEEDFLSSNQTPEEFFGGESIKTISTFKTQYNTDSVSIELH